MKLVESRYWHSAGGMFVMWGKAEAPLIPGGFVWFCGSVNVDIDPIITFFKTEEARDDDDENGIIETRIGFDAEWVVELWKEAFRYAIANSESKTDFGVYSEARAVEDYAYFLNQLLGWRDRRK